MAGTFCFIAFVLVLGQTAAEIQDVGWWKNTVFYQIYPRSFMDANNDGIGDLIGIANKMEHFRDAGIGAIWLSPIYASPMVDFGYDISNFLEPQPEYGTMEDFETLMTKAKALNVKVILDLVPNHSSDEHEWFKSILTGNNTYKDYYVWSKGRGQIDGVDIGTAPNNWISLFGGSAWTYNNVTDSWYFHQFHRKQPDLNYRNEKVRTAMENVIKFWLGKGVDGFRVDAVPHLFEVEDLRDEPFSNEPGFGPSEWNYLSHPYTKDQPETYDLVKSWRKVLDDYADRTNTSEKVMMTEAYTSLENTTRFYDSGSHVPFNFLFLRDVSNTSDPADFKKVIDSWITEANKKNGTPNWVMANHDNPRTPTRYPGRGDQMNMLTMILPGVAVTYYGEEIGMVDKSDISWEDTKDPQACQAGKDKFQEKSRDPTRTPMQWDNTANAGFNNGTVTPWIPVHKNYVTLNLAAQKAAATSSYKIYQKLTELKSTTPALKDGTVEAVVSDDKKALSIVRNAQNESVVLVINFSNDAEVTVNIANKISSALTSNATVAAASMGSSINAGTVVDLSNLKIPAKHSVVLVANTIKPPTEDDGNGVGSIMSSAKIIMILVVSILIKSN